MTIKCSFSGEPSLSILTLHLIILEYTGQRTTHNPAVIRNPAFYFTSSTVSLFKYPSPCPRLLEGVASGQSSTHTEKKQRIWMKNSLEAKRTGWESLRLGQPLLLWGTQAGFSRGVTELPRASPSLSSSSSPSESRSEICCCSSGLISFSARTSARRQVG